MRRAIAVIAVLLAGCQSSDVSRDLGARCTTARECDDRCLTASASYPDGFCTVNCSTGDECPSDAACVADEGGACMFTCREDRDCEFLGAAWRCHDSALRGQPETKVKTCRGQ